MPIQINVNSVHSTFFCLKLTNHNCQLPANTMIIDLSDRFWHILYVVIVFFGPGSP
jgi:hypothetical protein